MVRNRRNNLEGKEWDGHCHHAPRKTKLHFVTFSFRSRGANRSCHTPYTHVCNPAESTAALPFAECLCTRSRRPNRAYPICKHYFHPPPDSSSSILVMFFPNFTIPVHIDVTISSQKPWTVHKDLSSVNPIHVPLHTYWSESMEPRGSSARATSA